MTWTHVTTAPQGSDEWLEARRGGIGGSDVAAVLGLSPWATPLDVWLAKTRGSDAAATEAMDWGHRLEPLVRARFAEGRTAWVDEVPGTVSHDAAPFMRASLDGCVQDAEGTAVLEIKTSRSPFAQLPQQYLLQVTHCMGVTGWTDVPAHVACLFGGNTYVEFRVEFDRQVWEDSLDYCSWWWREHVAGGKMPEVDPVRDAPTMPSLWQAEPGAEVEIGPELAVALRDARAAAAAAATDLEVATAAVMDRMRTATVATCGGERIATWNERKGRTAVDTEALKADGLYDTYARTGKPTRVFLVDRKWAAS
jgi:putative phage-type endonuclease